MTAPAGSLDVARDAVAALAGVGAATGDDAGAVRLEDGFGPPTLHVPVVAWRPVLSALRDRLGLTFFDWLSAVDELDGGFSVVCHLAVPTGRLEHLLVATVVPRAEPRLTSVVPVWAGAAWHERETHEMFGIAFDGGVGSEPLLLPDGFQGHPLRKDFVLAARVAKAWPGAKEPGESDADAHASPSRRRQRPPGVPEPEAWGPREPGSADPDPLAPARAAAPGPGQRRARRSRRATPPPPGDADA